MLFNAFISISKSLQDTNFPPCRWHQEIDRSTTFLGWIYVNMLFSVPSCVTIQIRRRFMSRMYSSWSARQSLNEFMSVSIRLVTSASSSLQHSCSQNIASLDPGGWVFWSICFLIPGKLQLDVIAFMEIWGCHSKKRYSFGGKWGCCIFCVYLRACFAHNAVGYRGTIITELLRTRSFSATYCTPSSRLVTSVIHGRTGQWLPPFSWALPCLKKHWLILVMLWHYEGRRSLSPIGLFGGLCRCAYPFTGGSVVSLHKSGHRWVQCFGHTWL